LVLRQRELSLLLSVFAKIPHFDSLLSEFRNIGRPMCLQCS